MTVLLNNVSSNQESIVFKSTGGTIVVFIRADNYGGGEINILTSPPSDGLNRFTILTNGVFEEDSDVKIDYLPTGTFLKVSLISSSGAANVFVEVSQ